MIASDIPNNIIQWDCRSSCLNPNGCALSFYCNDQYFQSVISNPDKYLDVISKYQCVIGMDASPFDNMPPVVQCSQIYVNLAVTYYFGRRGIKIIPNVRLGTKRTYSSLDAYPKGTLIAVGTNGFIKNKSNRAVFIEQVKLIVDKLEPIGIIIYGPFVEKIFEYAESKKIKIYQYDSYIMKRKSERNSERI